jgi:hypothetical protein
VVRASLPPEGIDSRLELALLRLVESYPVPKPVLQHERAGFVRAEITAVVNAALANQSMTPVG